MTRTESGAAVRVLVVDDHADVRFLIRVLLRDAGPPLEPAGEAATADEALTAVEALGPDAVVLDALMPVTDGFQTAEMILARRPGLPILLCSAVVDDEVRARAEASGIAGCLSKDDFDRIPAAILTLVGRA